MRIGRDRARDTRTYRGREGERAGGGESVFTRARRGRPPMRATKAQPTPGWGAWPSPPSPVEALASHAKTGVEIPGVYLEQPSRLAATSSGKDAACCAEACQTMITQGPGLLSTRVT